MDYKMIEIYNREIKKGKTRYNFIIREKWIPGWGVRFSCGRVRPKFYEIKKNGHTILSTSLWQTWRKHIRDIEKGEC